VLSTTLGTTGLTVSPIGLGLAALGRPAYVNLDHSADVGAHDVASMRSRCHEVLDAAREQGIRYVDAARSYGRAEEFLASWLEDRQVDPAEVTVGSKWGYEYTGGWRLDAEVHERKDHSVGHLRHQWAESRALLGSSLDLYQVHSATFETGVLDDRAVLDELAGLREQGVVIGVSVSGPDQKDLLRKSMEVEYDGAFLFATVQASWNLLERSAEPALEEAGHEGIGVIVKEAVANGRLTERCPDPDLLELLQDAATAAGSTVDGLAMAAPLSLGWSDVVLSGAATPDHLLSNLGALDVDWSEDLDRRTAGLVEEPAAYWSTRAALPWT
jgi:aryl-alcohol dehydrogenase-like predicted oxidoreductase